MRIAGAALVVGAEESRVSSMSIANALVIDGPHTHWRTAAPRSPHRRRRRRQKAIAGSHNYVVDADVRRCFPSLDLGLLRRLMQQWTGCAGRDIDLPITLLSVLATSRRRLPIGPDLASILGTAALRDADLLLEELIGTDSAVRWVDDITMGADTHGQGQELLDLLQDGPLKRLGVEWHPDKTRITRSELWTPTAGSYLAPDVDEPGGPLSCGQLPRSKARRLRDEIVADNDAERAAEALASALGRMLCDHRNVVRPLVELGVDTPAVGDRAVISLTQRAADPWGDDVADALLDLAEHTVPFSPSGRDMLIDLSLDADGPPRVRGAAAWYLASAETFDRRILEVVDRMRPTTSRAVLAAASRAGHEPTQYEVARAIN